ncbi:hypothetical protein BDR07DRAFT_782713 [Suillus spraguei]|nr:hypothetical protein BDR07DRAFT_782713 [Suillus spraguei]
MQEYLDLGFRDVEDILTFDYSLESSMTSFYWPFLSEMVFYLIFQIYTSTRTDWSACLMCTRRSCHRWLSPEFHFVAHWLTISDNYINEGGVINTKRMQIVLDEMTIWERKIFEKEYVDSNWFKGKRSKHVEEMELVRKRAKLGTVVHSSCRQLTISPC